MRRRLQYLRVAAFVPLATAALLLSGDGSADAIDPTEGCPRTSWPSNQQGGTLKAFATASEAGVVYDDNVSKLRLKKAGGQFKATLLPLSDTFNVAAAGDFDEDGWQDIVVSSSGNRFVRFYKNRTFENPEPNWLDPADARTPYFVRTTDIEPSAAANDHASMVSGDFDNDGHLDVAHFRASNSGNTVLNTYRLYRGNGNGTFRAPYNLTTNPASLGYLLWSSTNAVTADYNGDGWLDIIWGTKTSSSNSSAAVLALLNDCPDIYVAGQPCSTAPRFVATSIVSGLDFGPKGANAVNYRDFNGDGSKDLVIGSPSSCNSASAVRIYPGLAGGGIDNNYKTLGGGVGAATVMLAADFSLDGKTDLIYGTDEFNCGSHLGGQTFYFKNNATTDPFNTGLTQQLSFHQSHNSGNLYDFDLGVVLDYDNDPDNTADFLIADGNDSGTFFVFANRVVNTYVECGDVQSGILDLGPLENEEMVVTAARLSPDAQLPAGTSLTYYMSNEDPANWQVAGECTDDPSDYCVSFPKPVGRKVRWKANMCSNSTRTQTPTITGVTLTFDYTPAEQHFRSGVVVHDGVAYLGAFRQPGDRGHFYALDAALSQTYWDTAEKLASTSDASRKLYTATPSGNEAIEFRVSNASNPDLIGTLGVASAEQAQALVEWARSARFGIGETSVLGAVESSTPAVVVPPVQPVYYSYVRGKAREDLDAFLAAHADRPTTVLFGSKDGFIHAIWNDATNIADNKNGKEAWAYVPPRIAARMAEDAANDTATAFPDGSPTVADLKLSDGQWHTVALISGGNGGKSVAAIDITDAVAADGTVNGPTPLWEVVPGGAEAGQGYSKPSIARVRIDEVERHVAILATGVAFDDLTPPYSKGRDVYGVDMSTGTSLWRFRAACPVTTDLILFETDDAQEPDAPAIDGFIDRVVFADNCGNVYKINPNVAYTISGTTDGWITGIGTIDTGAEDPAGNASMALFSTQATSGALGQQRPIVGTMGARPDNLGRMTIFFGTGGIESYDPSQLNAFYAVYADTGEIRDTVAGTCDGSGNCEKFYGGVVVTKEQVLVTRSIDPPVGTQACEFGRSEVFGLDLNTFEQDFSTSIASATVSSLYGDAGALYFTTLSGETVRVGTPRAASAGGDSAAGAGGGTSEGDGFLSETEDFIFVGWRQLL